MFAVTYLSIFLLFSVSDVRTTRNADTQRSRWQGRPGTWTVEQSSTQTDRHRSCSVSPVLPGFPLTIYEPSLLSFFPYCHDITPRRCGQTSKGISSRQVMEVLTMFRQKSVESEGPRRYVDLYMCLSKITQIVFRGRFTCKEPGLLRL